MPGRDGAAGMRVNKTLYSFVVISKKAWFTSQFYFIPLTALQRPCAPFVKSPGNYFALDKPCMNKAVQF